MFRDHHPVSGASVNGGFNASQNCVQFLVVYLSLPQAFPYAAFSCAYHSLPSSSPPSRPWGNEFPGDASMCEVVGSLWVVQDGTYLGQFSAGCLECSGVIGINSVGESSR